MENDFLLDIDFDLFEENKEERVINEEVYEIEKDKEKKEELLKSIEEKATKIDEKKANDLLKIESGTNLSSQQLLAIDLFINGENKTQIAKKVGVTRATIIKWFKKDEIKKEIQEREKDRDNAIYHELVSYVPKSVKMIKEMMESEEVEPKDRLRAIQMLWDATGFSKKKEEEQVKNQTIIAINPEIAPNKTVVNNMVERVIEEDDEETKKIKDNIIDV